MASTNSEMAGATEVGIADEVLSGSEVEVPFDEQDTAKIQMARKLRMHTAPSLLLVVNLEKKAA